MLVAVPCAATPAPRFSANADRYAHDTMFT
jgi:hypothetical protein